MDEYLVLLIAFWFLWIAESANDSRNLTAYTVILGLGLSTVTLVFLRLFKLL